jgi:hypothetical protein
MDKKLFASSVQSVINDRRKANNLADEILERGTVKYQTGVSEEALK